MRNHLKSVPGPRREAVAASAAAEMPRLQRHASGFAPKADRHASIARDNATKRDDSDFFEAFRGDDLARERTRKWLSPAALPFEVASSHLEGAESPHPLERGDFPMCGNYSYVAELAKGGMADLSLVLAKSPCKRFRKLVAIKRLRGDWSARPDAAHMFLGEARLGLLLHHPNVVETLHVVDAGEEAIIVMEYLEGQPLNRILDARRSANGAKRASLRFELTILADILAGLHHAHTLCDLDGTALNVVHRDVSPQNVLVTYAGQSKVLDFGIATIDGQISPRDPGDIWGKASYMAPELAQGSFADHRADIFAAGVMLFEIALGRRMWAGVPKFAVLARLCTEDHPRFPRAENPSVDEELNAICATALAPSPGDRFSSAAAMQEAVEAYLDSLGGRMSPRQIAAWMCENFHHDRSRSRESIASHMREHASGDRAQQLEPSSPTLTERPDFFLPAKVEGQASTSQFHDARHFKANLKFALSFAIGFAIAAVVVVAAMKF